MVVYPGVTHATLVHVRRMHMGVRSCDLTLIRNALTTVVELRTSQDTPGYAKLDPRLLVSSCRRSRVKEYLILHKEREAKYMC